MNHLHTCLFVCGLIIALLVPTSKAQESTEGDNIKFEVFIDFEDQELKQHRARIETLLIESFSEYVSMFGGMPKKVDGTPYTELKITVTRGSGGESGPESITLGIDDTKLYGFYGWELVLLHEVFHLWNTETFQYQGNGELWFNEGAADYYAFKLASKIGIIPPEEVVTRFAVPISNYLRDDELGRLAISGAVGVRDGPDHKPSHNLLTRHGGFTALMVLDHQIRSDFTGVFSLDYLMRELYLNNSRDNKYSNQTLIQLIDKSTGFDARAFFRQYIESPNILPIKAYFDIEKLSLSHKNGAKLKDRRQLILSEMLHLQ